MRRTAAIALRLPENLTRMSRVCRVLGVVAAAAPLVVAACSTSMNVAAKPDGATAGGAGGAGGQTIITDGGAGGTAGGAGGQTFVTTGGIGGQTIITDGGAGGTTGGAGGSSECWWHDPDSSGGSGSEPTPPDGWPDSPKRTPGPSVARARVDAWTMMSNVGAPSGPRSGATAVWTGKEMIVWGGYTNRNEATGGRYDPVTDIWKAMSTSVAPKPRQYHVAVWTGTEMIVWGGVNGTDMLASGGRYDPASDRWSAMNSSGAPVDGCNRGLRAVWTGAELIVWPACHNPPVVGGRYDPVSDTWRTIQTAGATVSQSGSSLVWTGSELIVWGGDGSECASAKGARYNPVTDTWRSMTTLGAPHPRANHGAVWTGTQMVVWGGSNFNANAASYDPVADAWYAVSAAEAPSPRINPVLFFLPDATAGAGCVLAWGGYLCEANTGGLYDFGPDQWGVVAPFPVSPTEANADDFRTTAWTGTEMIVWDAAAGVGARYRP